MKIFFGTDGWRAIDGIEINTDTVSVIAQAFSDYVTSKHSAPVIAIGYDTRTHSQLFAETFAGVLSGNKIKVLLSDKVTPTPMLSFAVKELQCDAGVMITASHNPKEYNGIKFKSSLGSPFSLEETKCVESYLYTSPVQPSDNKITLCDFISPYYAHIEKIIDFKAIKESGITLLIDSMGGAGLTYIQQFLSTHNIQSSTIFGEAKSDFYGRAPEPIEKNLLPLLDTLKKENFAFGIATDGDADRMGVGLDNGVWLSAQDTILLLTDYVKNQKGCCGGIVKTSSVTDKVRTLFEEAETPVYEVQVGFKYIADIMTSHPIAFGGEESGGFGYGIHIPERDGIFSTCLLLEMLAKSPYKTLSDYYESKKAIWGEIFYDRIDLYYDKEDKNDLLPNLYRKKKTAIGNFIISDTQHFCSSRGIINGLKFSFGDCKWVLIRSSETENIIRFYAEGCSQNEVSTLLSNAQEIVFE